MARPKGSHDIAPQVRGAFLRALKLREDRRNKKSLSELIDDKLDEDVLGVLKAMAQFVPKEMLLQADITTRKADELSDDELLSIATSGSEGTAEEASSESPVH